MTAVALIGGLAVQAVAPAQTALPEDPALASRRLRMPVPPAVPAYAAITSAPVFTPDRRPGGAELPGLRLVGIAAFGRSLASAVLRAPDGTTRVVRTGESLQGWRLISVGADRANFEGPSGPLRLSLNAAPAPPAAAADKEAANP